jgi:hypothetical protein
MARELMSLPNPDNTPGAVSTGYQRQNTNIFALQTGLDTTEPFDNGNGTITIPAGGLVEVNGVIFKLPNAVTINKTNTDTANWIAITPSADKVSADVSAVERPGVWSPDKQGFYNGASRTLNWVSKGNPSGSLPTAIYIKTTKGTEEYSLKKGWHYFELVSGVGGGNASNGGNAGSASGAPGGGGNGGIPSTHNIIKKIVLINTSSMNIQVKVGGNGLNGENGENGTRGGDYTGSGGGGGGGGGGAGEESSIIELGISTHEVIQGQGGNGGNGGGPSLAGQPSGTKGGGGGGVPPGSGAHPGNSSFGGPGGGSLYSEGRYGGAGGKGGDTGSDGKYRPNDDPAAGYCKIYKLEN